MNRASYQPPWVAQVAFGFALIYPVSSSRPRAATAGAVNWLLACQPSFPPQLQRWRKARQRLAEREGFESPVTQQQKSFAERALELFSSELERAERCDDLPEDQGKNRSAGKSVANISSLADQSANVKSMEIDQMTYAPVGPETRYSSAVCMGTRTALMTSEPNPEHVSTSFV
jgi:hypothetical protein